MPQVIIGFPAGFNDLVGNNNFGEAPRQLSDVVVPTVDIGEQYLAARQVVAFNAGGPFAIANGANGGAGFTINVPAGELWRVYGYSALLTCGAGDSLAAQTILTVDGVTTATGAPILLPNNTVRWIHSSQTPFWARAGSRISVWGSEVVAAPTCSLTVLCTKLKG